MKKQKMYQTTKLKAFCTAVIAMWMAGCAASARLTAPAAEVAIPQTRVYPQPATDVWQALDKVFIAQGYEVQPTLSNAAVVIARKYLHAGGAGSWIAALTIGYPKLRGRRDATAILITLPAGGTEVRLTINEVGTDSAGETQGTPSPVKVAEPYAAILGGAEKRLSHSPKG